jgi:hypothetical protein
MIAECWADGPRSDLPTRALGPLRAVRRPPRPPRPEEHGLDLDVKLFFALTNAVLDAGICAWDNKCFFASVRPVTAVRWLSRTRRSRRGRGRTRARGRSTARPGSRISRPRSPRRRSPITRPGTRTSVPRERRSFGSSPAATASEARSCSRRAARDRVGSGAQRRRLLSWATFSEAADQAGISRRYGGIHFEQGDIDARRTGARGAAGLGGGARVLQRHGLTGCRAHSRQPAVPSPKRRKPRSARGRAWRSRSRADRNQT